MIALGDMRIHDDEVEDVRYRPGVLVLRLRRGLHDLPLLLELPGRLALNWYPEDDPRAGIPVRLLSWRFERVGLLSLRCDVLWDGQQEKGPITQEANA